MHSSIQPATTGLGPADQLAPPHAAPDAASGQIAQAVEFIIKSTQLGEQGRQALKQWTSWTAYVATLADDDPHLTQLPGWNVVLPIDHAARACTSYRHSWNRYKPSPLN